MQRSKATFGYSCLCSSCYRRNCKPVVLGLALNRKECEFQKKVALSVRRFQRLHTESALCPRNNSTVVAQKAGALLPHGGRSMPRLISGQRGCRDYHRCCQDTATHLPNPSTSSPCLLKYSLIWSDLRRSSPEPVAARDSLSESPGTWPYLLGCWMP